MSFSPCPVCGGMLEGYPGSPCCNPSCRNSRRGRELQDTQRPAVTVALREESHHQPDEPDEHELLEAQRRRDRRKAARAARRHNRRHRR